MKETLEEAAQNAFKDFKSKNPIVPQKHILPFKLGYIEGVKWQQEVGQKVGHNVQVERMYSEKEVLTILKSHKEFIVKELKGLSSFKNEKEWFEQYRKK